MKNKSFGLLVAAFAFFALSVLLLIVGKYAIAYNDFNEYEGYKIEFFVFAPLLVSISLTFASFVVYLYNKGQGSNQIRLGLNEEVRD